MMCTRSLLARAAALALTATLPGASSRAQAPLAPPPAPPKVVSVDLTRAGLGDRITLVVEGLDEVLRQAGACSNVTLFVGDLALKGLPPDRCDPDDGHVGFRLVRTGANDAAWHALLGRPRGFSRDVKLTLGASSDRSFPSDVTGFRLIVIPHGEFWGFLVFALGFVALFVLLAQRSELLRDAYAEPAPGQRRPFSLARCQMAFWGVLVVLAYSFQWLVTGELDTITDSVLALIGISSGTALGAAMIDAGRASGQGSRAENVDLSAAARGPARGGSSGNFLTDILSDQAGVSIQRFQMLGWTILLGLIFCSSIYRSLQMPDFSPTLLGLMGISSGTYLGFKFPENQGRQAPRPQQAGTTPG
jgi:hypothetical protein